MGGDFDAANVGVIVRISMIQSKPTRGPVFDEVVASYVSWREVSRENTKYHAHQRDHADADDSEFEKKP